MSNGNNQLQKTLTFVEAIAIVIGMVIGSGVFFKARMVFSESGSPFLGLMSWVVGGIITLAAGLTVAEIAAAIPVTGGLYAYLDKLYGRIYAFMLGWVQSVVYYPASAAALAIIFATQAGVFYPMTKIQANLLAIGTLLFLVLMNVISTKFGGRIQTVATIGKLIPLVVIIVLGMAFGKAHNYTPVVGATSTAAGFGAAILGTLWAYDGWINVGNIAGELKNPARDLPKSIIVGLLIVVVVYLSFNAALVNVLPASALAVSPTPSSDVANVLFGNIGGAIISVGIMVSIFGAMNGYVMTGARVPLAMGEKKQLPFANVFGAVHPKFKTPANATIIQSLFSIIYILTGSFDKLTNMVVFVLWIFFIMAVYGVFILRRKFPEIPRPYKVPFFPIIPIIGIVGGLYIVINTLITPSLRPDALTGIGVTLIGLPVFYYLEKKNKAEKQV